MKPFVSIRVVILAAGSLREKKSEGNMSAKSRNARFSPYTDNKLEFVLGLVICLIVLAACELGTPVPANTEPPTEVPTAPVIEPTSASGFEGVVSDEGGSRIADVVIVFQSADGRTEEITTTSSDGKYHVTVPPGAYTVTASHKSYQQYTSGQNNWTCREGGPEVNDIRLAQKVTELPPTGTIDGIVVDLATGGKIPNVVIVFSSTNGSFNNQVTTDANGNFHIDLPQGGYHVSAQCEGHEPFDTGAGAIGVTGGVTTSYTIEMRQAAVIPAGTENGKYQGIVYDRNTGQAISGVRIVFESPDGSVVKETFSEANGGYQIELPIGGYYVSTTHEAYQGYTTKPGLFVVPGTGTYTGNINLLPISHTGAPYSTPLPQDRPGAESAPVVEIYVNPLEVAVGQTLYVQLSGSDENAMASIWWWADQSNDPELHKAHWFDCPRQAACENTWQIVPSAPGDVWFCANSRDVDYGTQGGAHQASEGRGIPCVLVRISP